MSDAEQPVETMDLVGGDLCLDFTNTASARRHGPLRDKLGHYGDLVTWAERVGVLPEALGRDLRAEARRRPEAAEGVLEAARELRESIYRVFSARATGESPPPADLKRVSEWQAEAGGRRGLEVVDGGFEYVWPGGAEWLEQMLWPVAVAAAELLTSGELERVKECAGDNCTWLFYDTSKNRSRRWCDMRECGNRAKARRHYARRRQRSD